MIKFSFNCLELRIITDKGLYGQKISFSKGLNIIRAENTSGKSSLINSIYYALGFESLLSNRKGPASLKPVLKREGKYNQISFKVIESSVFLEISNSKGKTVTLNRQITGQVDSDLIKVIDGPQLTLPNDSYSINYYYLNREGSAQRDRGFHKFLSNFLMLDIPFVSRYQGADVPLYLQCIVPLMFIEQTKGWSGIQATTPKLFGIQNVNNVSIEYLLNLDVQKNKLLRERLAKEKVEINQEWMSINNELKIISNSVNGVINNELESPKAEILDSDLPRFQLVREEKVIEVDSYLVTLREKLITLKENSSVLKTEIENVRELMERLGQLESKRIVLLGKLRETKQEIANIEADILLSRDSLVRIESDIKKHFDLSRILSMGAPLEISLAENKCPTCKQDVPNSLIPDIKPPMTIEDNIKFLREQKSALAVVERQNIKVLENLNKRYSQLNEELKADINMIRSIKNDLYRNSFDSETTLREQIVTDNYIKQVEDARNAFNSVLEKFNFLAERYKIYLVDQSRLPENFFSDVDLEKIEALKNIFNQLIQKYGYRSTSTGDVEISKDNYLPICSIEGFELALDASASDNIRIIWAYTIALLSLSNKFDTNHWGVVIFDEPEQQKMKDASSMELYRTVASLDENKSQVIIATSEELLSLKEKIKGFKTKIINLDEIVIRPDDQWYEKLTTS